MTPKQYLLQLILYIAYVFTEVLYHFIMKIRDIAFAALFLGVFFANDLLGQQNRQRDPVTYEELYDDPESVNKLFVAFQPIFGELWATNPHAGFGIEGWYYLDQVADFRIHLRMPYGKGFDMARNSALHNSSMDSEPFAINHFEIGGSYHFKSSIEDSETKMVLYKRNYKGTRWTAQVPLQIVVPSKVRKVYAARFGGIWFDSSTDLNRIIERQDENIYDRIQDENGNILPRTYTDNNNEPQQVNIFGNVDVKGFYAGVSMSWIRNVAVDIDNHDPGVDDRMITAFFDLLIAPWVSLDNVYFQDIPYSVSEIETNPVGFRLGLDGKFNRTLSWGYGGEIGIKPGLKKGGFMALIKISLPIYGTNLDYEVEAFGK